MGRRAGVTAEETRAELLDATMKVLLAKGYEGTRVSEIAREAGVTSGAIYNHFASKTELLAAAISEQGPDAISELMRSGRTGSVLEAFGQVGRGLPERSDAHASILLELAATSTRDPEIAQVMRDEFSRKEVAAADLMRLGQDEGEIDASLDVEALTRFTTMLALGSIIVSALDLKAVDDAGWAAVIDRMLGAATPTVATPTDTTPTVTTPTVATPSTATPQGVQE